MDQLVFRVRVGNPDSASPSGQPFGCEIPFDGSYRAEARILDSGVPIWQMSVIRVIPIPTELRGGVPSVYTDVCAPFLFKEETVFLFDARKGDTFGVAPSDGVLTPSPCAGDISLYLVK
jgi:hypothetical protein